MSLPDTCLVPVCDRPTLARGYCGGHYNRWRTGRPLDTPIKGDHKPRPLCTYEGCTRPRNTKGFCNVHWTRKEQGNVDAPVRFVNPDQGCRIPKCREPHLALGYCNTHYQRHRTGGDMVKPLRKGYKGANCVIPGCQSPVRSSAMCKSHYSTCFTYNLTSVQLMTIQSAGCSICGQEEKIRIDHDHSCCGYGSSCGECIRGGLCDTCNTGLGLFKDSPAKLRSAVEYLRKNGIVE